MGAAGPALTTGVAPIASTDAQVAAARDKITHAMPPPLQTDAGQLIDASGHSIGASTAGSAAPTAAQLANTGVIPTDAGETITIPGKESQGTSATKIDLRSGLNALNQPLVMQNAKELALAQAKVPTGFITEDNAKKKALADAVMETSKTKQDQPLSYQKALREEQDYLNRSPFLRSEAALATYNQ
jgi:hypothetical protein